MPRKVKACQLVAATRSTPGLCGNLCPREGGVARRKTQTYGVRDPCGPRRAPRGAPQTAFVRRRAALSGLRSKKDLRSSASSWQGFVVSPGGAPASPGCLICVTKPAGAAPHPASRRLMVRPSRRTRWMQDKGEFVGGDNSPRIRHSGASRNPGQQASGLVAPGPRLPPG